MATYVALGEVAALDKEETDTAGDGSGLSLGTCWNSAVVKQYDVITSLGPRTRPSFCPPPPKHTLNQPRYLLSDYTLPSMAPKSPAQSLLEKADKKANSSTGWFGSSSTKFEEAGDLYQQAANSFKIDKMFKEAGDCFAREAECREKCKEANDAANAWWNSAKAYKRGYPERACKQYQD